MDRHLPTADDLHEMAENLRRLNTGSSRASRDTTSSSPVGVGGEGYDAQAQRRPPPLHGRVASVTGAVGAGNGAGRSYSSYGSSGYAQPLSTPQQSPYRIEFQPSPFDNSSNPPWLPNPAQYDSPTLEHDNDFFPPYPSEPLQRASTYDGPSSPRSIQFQRPPTARKDSRASERRPSKSSSVGGYSLYPSQSKPPPASKPLPPLPANRTRKDSSRRNPSQGSIDAHSDAGSVSVETSRFSKSSLASSNLDRVSDGTSPPSVSAPFPQAQPPPSAEQRRAPRQPSNAVAPNPTNCPATVELVAWKHLSAPDKSKDPGVYYFDISFTSATLVSKHGNNMIKVWQVASGVVLNCIKISCYTTAQARSREYFVRSHAILSEPSTTVAIATGFGDTIEIWDWQKKKKLQSLDHADRWAAVRSDVYEAGWCPLVTYRGDNDSLVLYAAAHGKKPFTKARIIELRKAGLPFVPKYPELCFSATGPLLVAASGPRPPRMGHPPPERETLLVAWEIHDDGGADAVSVSSGSTISSTPYKVVTPWQHAELDTALPCSLATYGSVAVSIWIPASYRAVPVPAARGGVGYNLAPVAVPWRHVLVWDFSASSTRTFSIPNTATSCVSPDCRFVAYCDATGTELGARGSLVILDAMTGREMWCWPDPDAGAAESGPRPGFEQLEDLSMVTELMFSADGGFLFVGDAAGSIGIYEVREHGGGVQLRPR
ncbi:hypothetical protein QBC46DRAFT_336473 [Diplogelasinospora grovesii]|uniref:WD40 repeat-like protein n=1 Tax=Diplogelasinospora grovesii TaxID=303347 RepID=A0AAN6NIE0_9PEZI|nr:hypothetical protein QBC46DRAFT_336473 [Diplogelasinospora grovesii]